MANKLPAISGQNAMRALVKAGFAVKRQRSSHVILQKNHFVLSVPLHRTLKKGTLKAINKAGRTLGGRIQ